MSALSTNVSTVYVARPPHDVWEFGSDCNNWPIFAPAVDKVVQVSGAGAELGAEYVGHGKLLFAPIKFGCTVVEAVVDEVIAIQSTVASFAFVATIRMRPHGTGTVVTMTAEIEQGFGGLFADVADSVTTFAYRRILHAKMLALADAVDGGRRQDLSLRQRLVLRLLRRGRTNYQIAETLGMPSREVVNHVTAILAAYRVPDRETLAIYSADESDD